MKITSLREFASEKEFASLTLPMGAEIKFNSNFGLREQQEIINTVFLVLNANDYYNAAYVQMVFWLVAIETLTNIEVLEGEEEINFIEKFELLEKSGVIERLVRGQYKNQIEDLFNRFNESFETYKKHRASFGYGVELVSEGFYEMMDIVVEGLKKLSENEEKANIDFLKELDLGKLKNVVEVAKEIGFKK